MNGVQWEICSEGAGSGRLTIKSQALKWYFLNKVQKCILDIFGTQLEVLEPWKLYDKKSIVTGAQKRVLN